MAKGSWYHVIMKEGLGVEGSVLHKDRSGRLCRKVAAAEQKDKQQCTADGG